MENSNGRWELIEDAVSHQQPNNALRHGARTVVRVAETALGLPGDIASLALSGANLAHRGVTGEWSPSIEAAKEYLPTAENIRNKVTTPLEKNVLPEGYLTPKDEYEQLADNLVSDFVSIITPTGAAGLLGKGIKGAAKVAKGAALSSGLSNIAGFLTKKAGGSEELGDAVKIGTMLGTSLIGVPRMKQRAVDLYEKVSKETPSTLKVSTKPLQDGVRKAEQLMVGHEATKGGSALRDYFKETMNNLIDHHEISVSDLMQADKGLNRVASQNPAIWKDVLKAKEAVSNGIMQAIRQSGRSDIVSDYESARRLYREALTSSKIQDWISHTAKSAFKQPITIPTAVLLGVYNPSLLPKVALGAAGVGVANSIGSVMKRIPGMLESPIVRRYYGQAISAAGQQSRPAFIKAAHMLDKAISKEAPQGQSQGRWELID